MTTVKLLHTDRFTELTGPVDHGFNIGDTITIHGGARGGGTSVFTIASIIFHTQGQSLYYVPSREFYKPGSAKIKKIKQQLNLAKIRRDKKAMSFLEKELRALYSKSY